MQIRKDKYNLGKSATIEITLKDYDKKANIMLDSKDDEINIGSSISGVVVDKLNNPIKNAIVKLMNNKLELLVTVRTDNQGKYAINIVPSSSVYTLLAITTGKGLEQSPSFALINGEKKLINFTLSDDPNSTLGTINGVLTNDGNKPVSGSVISLYKISTDSTELVAITYSDYEGEFIFAELNAGNYKVVISSLSYLPLEEVIVIDSGKIYSFKKSLIINPDLSNGAISGVITDNLNIAMPKADVILYKLDESNNEIPVAFTQTNFSGLYSFINVPFGSYFIKSNVIQNTDINTLVTPAVKITSATEIDTYEISTGILENGAIVDYSTGFVTSLGGVNDGAVTLKVTVEKAGLYNLAIQYTSADFNRPLMLEVNGKDNGEVYKPAITLGWEAIYSKITYVLTTLKAGLNTIKFHGDGINLAPNLNIVTLILNETESITVFATTTSSNSSIKTYNVSLGNFVGDIKSNTITNFAEGIGGPKNNSSTITVDVADTAIYYLAVKYLAAFNNLNFKVSVNNMNNLNNSKVYTVTQTKTMKVSDALTFTLPIALTAKSNKIEFNGDGKIYAPYFGEFTLSLPPVTQNLTDGIIENGAKLDSTKKFVTALGGANNGSSIVTVNVTNSGAYDLLLQYVGTNNNLPLKIDVNGTNSNTIYSLPATKGLTITDIKTFTIPLTLNVGNNTLKFYGNGKDPAANLSSFTLKSNNATTVKPTTSTIAQVVYDINTAKTGGTASLDKEQNLITGIGGKGNGFFTMDVTVKEEGEYVLRINYKNNNRKFKIDINGQYTGKVCDVIQDFIDVFPTLINLKAGKNILKFYGNGTELAPDLGSFTMDLNSPIKSRLSESIFNGTTKLLPSGVISSIGGGFENNFMLNYFAPYYGKYKLDMVFSSQGGILAIDIIDVNDINTGSVYNIPSAKTTTVAYSSNITLTERDNIIKFYGIIRNSLVPDIYSIDIKPIPLEATNKVYNFSEAVLENGVKSSTITNLVGWSGNGNKGTITVDVNMDLADSYDLNIQYVMPFLNGILYLNVNKEANNRKYYFPMTGGQGTSKFEIFTMENIKLNKGKNTLKFSADAVEVAPKLKNFKITKSEILPSTLPPGTFYAKNGILEKGAKVATFSKNFIDNIGPGSVTIKYNVEYEGLYDLMIEYLVATDNKTLLIEVNGVDSGESYTFTKTKSLQESDANTLIVPVLLNKGANSIKLYENKIASSPALGMISFTKAPEVSSYTFINSKLENGAVVSPITGFVSNLGGANNGIATVDVYASVPGDYYLTIKYLSTIDNTYIRIDVNGEPLNASVSRNLKFFKLVKTKSENMSDAKTLTKKITLNYGKNSIKFYNNETAYVAPKLGTFVISTNKVIQTFPIQSNNLSKGASLSIIEGFVSGIGGIKQGAVTIYPTIMKEGVYDLSFRYISHGMKRTMKIAINKDSVNVITCNLPSTGNYYDEFYAKTFTLPINLNLGTNTIKFYKGFGLSEGPEIGEITISQRIDTPIKIYKISEGIIKGKAIVDNTSKMVSNIGGSGNGEVTITVNTLSNNIYTLNIQYMSSTTNNKLFIDVNGKVLKNSYDIPMTLISGEVEIFSVDLNLNVGNNTIRFYGDAKNKGLTLGNITVITSIISSRNLMEGEYDSAKGILEKGAYINSVTGFVTNIGGVENGTCTVNVQADNSGSYSLLIEYMAYSNDNALTFDINNQSVGNIWIVKKAEFEASYLEVQILLIQGSNKIKFYSPVGSKTKPIFGPDLGIIKITPR